MEHTKDKSTRARGNETARIVHTLASLVKRDGHERSVYNDEMSPLGADDYCAGCGQIGCGHGC